MGKALTLALANFVSRLEPEKSKVQIGKFQVFSLFTKKKIVSISEWIQMQGNEIGK